MGQVMPPMNIQSSYQGDWLVPFLLVYGLVWLFVLGSILRRTDFDPVTKLTWVVVVIFVPLFGMVLYWSIAPGNPKNSPQEFSKKNDPSDQLYGTPWKDDSGYTAKNK